MIAKDATLTRFEVEIRHLVTVFCVLAASVLPLSLAAQDDNASDPVMTEADALEWQTQPIDFLVNPIYPPEQAEQVYQPLVEYLRTETGLDLQLITARNFHRYWVDARRNEAAPFILEDAHMASWRMNQHGYQPLAMASTPTSFSLLTMGHMADDQLEDFIGRQVSSLPSPSLGYVVLTNWFTNPLQQPLILSNATSWLDAIEIVFAGEADAAIVPQNLVLRYPNLYPIEQSDEMPGLTLSAASEVPESIRQTVTDALINLADNPDFHSALFELDIEAFVAANPDDFAELDQLLSTIFSL